MRDSDQKSVNSKSDNGGSKPNKSGNVGSKATSPATSVPTWTRTATRWTRAERQRPVIEKGAALLYYRTATSLSSTWCSPRPSKACGRWRWRLSPDPSSVGGNHGPGAYIGGCLGWSQRPVMGGCCTVARLFQTKFLETGQFSEILTFFTKISYLL